MEYEILSTFPVGQNVIIATPTREKAKVSYNIKFFCGCLWLSF